MAHATQVNEKTGNVRALVTMDEIHKAMELSAEHMAKVLGQKGYGTFVSSHEAHGVIRREFLELETAFQSGTKAQIKHELADVIVACQFTLACIEANTLDW